MFPVALNKSLFHPVEVAGGEAVQELERLSVRADAAARRDMRELWRRREQSRNSLKKKPVNDLQVCGALLYVPRLFDGAFCATGHGDCGVLPRNDGGRTKVSARLAEN